MAFIISKLSKRHDKVRRLFYLVANYRDGNKVKRETLLKLNECKTLSELMEFAEKKEMSAIERLQRNEEALDAFVHHGKVPVLMTQRHPNQIWKNLMWWVDKEKSEIVKWQNYKKQIKSYM